MSTRIYRALIASIALCGFSLVLGCGGTQVPPQDGECNPGREWVPPTQDDRGNWRSGFCRDIR